MFWSMAPLVLACIVLAGVLGMCSFAPNGPGQGPAPTYDAPAALQADADAPEDPDPAAEAARGLAGQLRQPRRHRRRPHRPVRASRSRAVSLDGRLPGAHRHVLSLTQSNADEDKLVASIDADLYPTGTQDVDGVNWVVYEGGEDGARAGVDHPAERPDRPGADRDNRCRAVRMSTVRWRRRRRPSRRCPSSRHVTSRYRMAPPDRAGSRPHRMDRRAVHRRRLHLRRVPQGRRPWRGADPRDARPASRRAGAG